MAENSAKDEKCSDCDYVASTAHAIKRHKNRVHNKKRKLPHKCTECDYKTDSMYHLKRHTMIKHNPTQKGMLSCTKCDFKAANKCLIKRHLRTKHNEELKPNQEMIHCPECDYKAAEIWMLKRHSAIHNKELKYNCPYCDFKHYRKPTLQIHINKEHDPDNCFKCPHCSYVDARSKWNVDIHIKTQHTVLKPHEIRKCEYCNYQVPKVNTRLFKLHMRRHTKEPLKCKLCSFETPSKYKMEKHSKEKHVPAKISKCNFCDYSTTNNWCLKMHVNAKHTWEKICKCSHCDYTATAPYILKNHVLMTHTPDAEQFYCGYCPYKIPIKEYLRVHIENKHIKTECEEEHCNFIATYNKMKRHQVNVHGKSENYFNCTVGTCTHQGSLSRIKKHFRDKMHEKKKDFTCAKCETKHHAVLDIIEHIRSHHSFEMSLSKRKLETTDCNENKKEKSHDFNSDVDPNANINKTTKNKRSLKTYETRNKKNKIENSTSKIEVPNNENVVHEQIVEALDCNKNKTDKNDSISDLDYNDNEDHISDDSDDTFESRDTEDLSNTSDSTTEDTSEDTSDKTNDNKDSSKTYKTRNYKKNYKNNGLFRAKTNHKKLFDSDSNTDSKDKSDNNDSDSNDETDNDDTDSSNTSDGKIIHKAYGTRSFKKNYKDDPSKIKETSEIDCIVNKNETSIGFSSDSDEITSNKINKIRKSKDISQTKLSPKIDCVLGKEEIPLYSNLGNDNTADDTNQSNEDKMSLKANETGYKNDKENYLSEIEVPSEFICVVSVTRLRI